MNSLRILTVSTLIFNLTVFSTFVQDINQFDNCQILLYLIGPITSPLLDPLPTRIKHPIQLTHKSAFLLPPSLPVKQHRTWILKRNLSYPSVLPDIGPTLSKSPLICKLLAVLVMLPPNLINPANMVDVFSKISSLRVIQVGFETEEDQFEDDYKSYFRTCLALVYLQKRTPFIEKFTQFDSEPIPINFFGLPWSSEILDKYHIQGKVFVKYFGNEIDENLKSEAPLILKIHSLILQSQRKMGCCGIPYYPTEETFYLPKFNRNQERFRFGVETRLRRRYGLAHQDTSKPIGNSTQNRARSLHRIHVSSPVPRQNQ